MAAKVAAAFPYLRKTIDRRFAAGVTTAISAAVASEWAIQELPNFPDDYKNELVRVEKVAWSNRCWVALARDDAGRESEYLYYRVRNITGKSGTSEIRTLLNAGFSIGEKTRYSEWWSTTVRGREEVVAYLARPGSVDETSSDLIQIARLAEPVIGRLLGEGGGV
jgi:hypothetical protein